MTRKNKKKEKREPRKPKIDLRAGVSRPKPISFQSANQVLQQAREYPILGCWVMTEWQNRGLTPVVVARKQPEERVIYGSFLVDLYCLGVKNAFWRSDISLKQFIRDLPELLKDSPEPCEADLAHELIYGSIEYARQYGFEPHFDYAKACLVLDPPEAHPRKNRVLFGKDGKPFFIAGPVDNARAIIAKLMQTAGKDNFDYMVMLGNPDNL